MESNLDFFFFTWIIALGLRVGLLISLCAVMHVETGYQIGFLISITKYRGVEKKKTFQDYSQCDRLFITHPE